MEQRIEIINNWNLKKIFNELEAGNIKIPRFQRSFIWQRNKVVKLLNSIYAQFPIGSFFFWVAPKEYKSFVREHKELNLPETPNANNFQFILDGQQRITSLYVALKGMKLKNIDYSSICFNLDSCTFKIPRKKKEPNNVPAWKLFDNKHYGQVQADYIIYDSKKDTQYAEIWRNCYDLFMNYPVSIVKSLHTDLDDVVEIFERINQGGRRLSLFDLVHASVWNTNFDLKEKIKTYNKTGTIKAHGGVTEKVIAQSLALNAFDDCRNKSQLNLTADIAKGLWKSTTNCINSAIIFLESMGIQGDISLYQPYIPVLQYYFYQTESDIILPAHRKHIEKWFWDTKFNKRYSNASLARIKEDSEWIVELINKY